MKKFKINTLHKAKNDLFDFFCCLVPEMKGGLLLIHKSKGYFTIEFDDGPLNVERQVMVNKLNDLSLDQWKEEVADFIRSVYTKYYQPQGN